MRCFDYHNVGNDIKYIKIIILRLKIMINFYLLNKY